MSNTIQFRRSASGSIPSLAPGELAWRDSDQSLWIGLSDGSGNFRVNTGDHIYADGSDGALTYDGSATVLGVAPSSSTYTLTRDIYASSITINSGVTVQPNGFRIFCTGILTVNGAISINGANASGATAGSGGGSSSSVYIHGTNGGAGGTGAGSNSSAQTASSGGSGGNGGAGGTGAAGTAGSANAIAAALGGVTHCAYWYLISSNQTSPAAGGTGGGGGGGDSTNAGGGGGGGGGVIGIAAPIVTGSGTISANGGNGATPSTGNCGGGGGGGGGFVMIICRSCSITPTATAGSKGLLSGSGANGVDGSAGQVLINYSF